MPTRVVCTHSTAPHFVDKHHVHSINTASTRLCCLWSRDDRLSPGPGKRVMHPLPHPSLLLPCSLWKVASKCLLISLYT